MALGVLLLIVAGLVLLFTRGNDEPAPRTAARQAAADKPVELPRGGRRLLPDRRIVAYYGAPQDDELGALGIGSPASAARKLERQARPYAEPERPVLPAMELIAVTAAAHPGEGERYNTRQDAAVIDRYLRAARKAKALLVLDIQPGRSDFYTEARRLERWLAEPDVGLALDPEWRMGPGQIPGQVIGSVAGARGQRGLGVAVADRRAQRPAAEALPHPPVHDGHGRRHAAAGAAGAGDGAQRRRLRHAASSRRSSTTSSPPRRDASSARGSSSFTVRTRT